MTDDHPLEAVFPPGWTRRTCVMGIINVTSDSFSGDGLLTQADPLHSALDQAHRFIDAGVDILDIGGESTRPGSQKIDAAEEQRRVLPVISALAGQGVILSVDTYKASVAQAALEAGANWINDIWGLRADPGLAKLAAKTGAPIVLMHNRSKPSDAEIDRQLGGRYVGVAYDDLLEDVKRELMESVALARDTGVADHQIILDPGIGFGKTVEQNLELVNRLGEIRSLGFPVLLGASRKSFIGYTLALPPDQRLEGSLAATAVGIVRGADVVRVHDVEAIVRVTRMVDAILQKERP